MTKTEKYLEGLTIHKVPYNIANTSDFKTNVMANADDNELFIITDTPTFSLKIGNVTYDGTSNKTATTATQSVSGLMSAADKKKLDGIAIDTALSSTSTNPVQNKVIKTELDNKLDKTGGTLTGNLTGKYLTGTWLQTTASTDLGRTPEKVAVLDVSGWVYYRTPAEIKSDIGADAVVTTSSDGLMSASDKSKLDGIAAGATANSASATTPKAAGTASVGSETAYARGDHVHPSDTSKFNVSGGTITGATTINNTLTVSKKATFNNNTKIGGHLVLTSNSYGASLPSGTFDAGTIFFKLV